MVRTLVAAFVVAYLPGALIFRVPLLNRPARAALSAEERAFWAVVLSTVWSLVLVLGLAGLGVYSFPRLIAITLAAAAGIVVIWRTRLRFDADAPRLSWRVLLPIALVALGCELFLPPSEYVIGGKDPGTYLGEGLQIARSGRLVTRERVVATVPPEYRDLFLPYHQNPNYYSVRFMGFFIQDPDEGRVIGQFPHLLPASIAIGFGLDGLRGALGTVGLWAIFGVLAVYFAGARLFGQAAAFGAAVLLAGNVIEVWFGRYTNSEVALQALLFAALLAFARALEGSQAFFGTLAGGLLGLMVFLRYEVVLAFPAFGLAATLAPVMRQRVGLAFGITLGLTALLGYAYLLAMPAYSAHYLGFTRDQGGWWLIAGGLVAAGLLRLMLRRPAFRRAVWAGLPAGLALVVSGLAIYAYFFRSEGNGTTEFDALAFRTFGWYVTPWVLGAAMAAFAFFVIQRFWRDPAFFLTFAAFGYLFYKTRIVPEHFWMTRRFLAVALPGVLLLVAALAHWIVGGEQLSRVVARLRGAAVPPAPARWLHVVGLLLLAAVLTPIGLAFWRASEPVYRHVEYAGLARHVDALAAHVGDRDLVIVESRVSDVQTLAMPLAYLHGRSVLVLSTALPPKRLVEGFVAWAGTQYDRVLFLGGGGTDLLTKRIAAEPLASDRFMVPEYDSPENAYPSGVRQKEFEFGLYRLTPRTAFTEGPVDLVIGTLDDLQTVGFHSKEGRPGAGLVYRWTSDLSHVVLLGIAADARTLTLWMSNGSRPDHLPPATVEVGLDDQILGSVTVGNALAPYTVHIPAELAARAAASPDPVRLSLRVPTWNPAAIGHGPDDRDVGVQVMRVQVR